MNKNKIYIVIFVLIAFALGVFVGYSKKDKRGYQDGWDAAKKRMTETGFYSPTGNLEMKGASGQVEDVNGNKITVRIRTLDPLSNPNLDSRVVTFTKDTKVFQITEKDPQVYQKEMEAARNNINNPENLPTESFGSPYEKKEVDSSILAKGQSVNVIAGADIKNQKEFEAVEIDVIVPPTVNAPTVTAPENTGNQPTPTAVTGDNSSSQTPAPVQEVNKN